MKVKLSLLERKELIIQSNPLHNEYPNIISEIILLETYIDSSATVLIGFTEGISCDLTFNIYDSETFDRISYALGTQLIIPSNGYLYSQGHTNSEFNIQKKYVFQDNKVTELFPELYYVGLDSFTLNPISIYSDWELSNKIAELPTNYPIEESRQKSHLQKIGNGNTLLKHHLEYSVGVKSKLIEIALVVILKESTSKVINLATSNKYFSIGASCKSLIRSEL